MKLQRKPHNSWIKVNRVDKVVVTKHNLKGMGIIIMDNELNFSKTLSENICTLRKKANLTQDALAEKLCISFQAVSKWENMMSSPDITLLPKLSEIFGVTIDDLFGLERKCINQVESARCLPWQDDNTLHAAVFIGQKLMKRSDDLSKFEFKYDGESLNVDCGCNLSCGDVGGAINAGLGVNCGDVGGGVAAGLEVNCGDVGGDVEANESVTCGDVGGDVAAGLEVNCGDIDGDVNAGGKVKCGDVGGDVSSCRNTTQN